MTAVIKDQRAQMHGFPRLVQRLVGLNVNRGPVAGLKFDLDGCLGVRAHHARYARLDSTGAGHGANHREGCILPRLGLDGKVEEGLTCRSGCGRADHCLLAFVRVRCVED